MTFCMLRRVAPLGCRFATILSAILIVAALGSSKNVAAAEPSSLRVYIGTYTSGGSQGIYQTTLNLVTGELAPPELADEAKNPSFLALPESEAFLYSVSEVSDYKDSHGGALSAFTVDGKSGNLALLNHQSSGGAGPCFVSLDAAGRHALTANYGSGSVAVLPIGADGKLDPASCIVQHEGSGPNESRQKGPHAHCIKLDPANKFALAADLGCDKVFVYRFDEQAGKLTPNDPPAMETKPGAGPRHLAFHPSGKFVYVINELDNTMIATSYDGDRGVLKPLQTVSIVSPQAPAGTSGAEVVVHPSGMFVYGSTRGEDAIAMFAIDETTGMLTPLGEYPAGGKTPRNFNIDPTGKFLLAALQGSDRVVVHAIDSETGKLTQTDHAIDVAMPVCVKFAK